MLPASGRVRPSRTRSIGRDRSLDRPSADSPESVSPFLVSDRDRVRRFDGFVVLMLRVLKDNGILVDAETDRLFKFPRHLDGNPGGRNTPMADYENRVSSSFLL
jgi:hypothetical protein